MNLLDLMGDSRPAPVQSTPSSPKPRAAAAPARRFTPRPVRPMWRDGAPIPGSDRGYVPHQPGDLRWLIHAYAPDGQPLGRWFRWSDSPDGWMWICIDPRDRTGINALPDTPPIEGRA